MLSGGVIMARIAGVDLPREKRVEIGLTYIYGIGLKTSQKLLKENNINPDKNKHTYVLSSFSCV